MTSQSIRVLVVDDHPIFRDGLAGLLASRGFEVVGRAETGTEGVAMAAELTPDVVIMDFSLPDFDGAEATRRILATVPTTAVIVVSMHEEETLVRAAVAAGARGYLVKGTRQDELVRAVQTVACGDVVFGAAVAHVLLSRAATPPPARAHLPADLTGREAEVLELLASGLPTSVIARRLDLAPKTVRNHISNIILKLHATDRVDAVLRARERGFGRTTGRGAH